MRTTLFIVSLLASVLIASTALAANPVYKWTDSTGHSHYSQTPPDGQKYQLINPAVSNPSTAESEATVAQAPKQDTPAAAPTPAQTMRNQLCETARTNVKTLSTKATVLADINNDGKPVTLNAAQHDAALAEANKQVGLYCTQ